MSKAAGKLATAEPTRSHRDVIQYFSPNSVGKYSDMISAMSKKMEEENKRLN
jgi:hypothetical protein